MGRSFRSLTTRLITWTLLACGGVYAATVVVSNALARRMALAAAEREAVSRAAAEASRVEAVLASLEERTRLLGRAVVSLDPSAPGVDAVLRDFVRGSPELHGAGLGFPPEPGAARSRYVERGDAVAEGAAASDLAAAEPGFRESEWYAAAMASGEPRWSEPRQRGDGAWLVAYSEPLGPGDGAARGVVAAFVSLSWLDRMVDSFRVSGGGFAVILSPSGRLLASSRRGVVDARRPLLEEMAPEQRARSEPIVRRMLAGETGFLLVELPDGAYRLTYQPVGRTGWSLGVLYPEGELLQGVKRLRLVQASLALTGLALLAVVVVMVSRRITRPVKALAASAEQMATGDLDAALPPAETEDEVGALARAFHHMRESLKAHVRDLQAATAARERLESELKIARRIQADMLPRPEAGGAGEGYELAATLVPARAVGGDFFDYFRVGTRVFVLVGDVSGKGVSAALFMARAKTLFETVAAREHEPDAILVELNRGLLGERQTTMYLTAVLGVLDTASGELSFAAAGHEPPILVRIDGPPEPIQAQGGPVVGLLDAVAYPLNRLRLAPGEAVVLYTDGVSEARNPADELFEGQRLLATLQRVGHESVRGISDGLLAAVRAFAGEAPQSDDITILTLRYLRVYSEAGGA